MPRAAHSAWHWAMQAASFLGRLCSNFTKSQLIGRHVPFGNEVLVKEPRFVHDQGFPRRRSLCAPMLFGRIVLVVFLVSPYYPSSAAVVVFFFFFFSVVVTFTSSVDAVTAVRRRAVHLPIVASHLLVHRAYILTREQQRRRQIAELTNRQENELFVYDDTIQPTGPRSATYNKSNSNNKIALLTSGNGRTRRECPAVLPLRKRRYREKAHPPVRAETCLPRRTPNNHHNHKETGTHSAAQ